MSTPSAPDSTKEKGGYPLAPTPYWSFWLGFFAYATLPLFLAFELISEIRAFLLRLLHRSRLHSQTTNARKAKALESAPPGKTHALEDWLARPTYKADTYEYVLPTRRTRLEILLCAALFAAYTKLAIILVLFDRHPEATAVRLRAMAKAIRERAQASKKFQLVFEKLLRFLRDVEASSAADISSFMRKWAMQMAGIGSVWQLKFANSRTCVKHVPKALYESTLATFALFHAHGGGFEAYYLDGLWKEEGRNVYGAVTLMMFFVIDKCYPEPSSKLVSTRGDDLEQILLVDRGLKFVRFVTCISSEDEVINKNIMMWDITRNCCNDFVESSWSMSCLERVIWMLEHGLSYASMELYESLKEQHGQRRVDMTHLNSLSLMTLSVAGLMRLRGSGDGPYKLTSRAEARIEVHGNLPVVTVADLVGLNLVERGHMDSFCIKRLPGTDRKYKAVAVGDSVKFVPSARREWFKAKMWQHVV